jgi:hypothetical protein
MVKVGICVYGFEVVSFYKRVLGRIFRQFRFVYQERRQITKMEGIKGTDNSGMRWKKYSLRNRNKQFSVFETTNALLYFRISV